MGEHCSSTEFSSTAEVCSKCKSRAVRDRYSLLLASKKNQNKTKAARRIMQVVKNNTFPIVDYTTVIVKVRRYLNAIKRL